MDVVVPRYEWCIAGAVDAGMVADDDRGRRMTMHAGDINPCRKQCRWVMCVCNGWPWLVVSDANGWLWVGVWCLQWRRMTGNDAKWRSAGVRPVQPTVNACNVSSKSTGALLGGNGSLVKLDCC